MTFALEVVGRDEATRQVVEAQADIAVTFAIGTRRDVNIEYSASVPVCAVVSPDHPLARRSRVDLADVCAHPLALSRKGSSQRELFDVGVRLEQLTVQVALECDRLSAIHEFVRSSDGVALTSDLGSTQTSGLVYVPLVHPVFEQRRAEVHTMLGRPQPTRVMTLVNEISSILGPDNR